jgi:hypothetical protein
MQPLLQWKSTKYYKTWAFICSPRYPACNAHASYCHLWPVRLYNIFPHYLINDTIFNKKKKQQNLLNVKCLFWFSLQLFFGNILHSKKNWARYDKKCILVFTPSTRSSSKILMKLEISRQIFEKFFSRKSIKWEPRCSMRTDGRTDRHDEANSCLSLLK